MSTVAALVTDLLFASKVHAASRSTGVAVQVVRTEAALLASLAAGARLVLVDLNAAGVDGAAAVAACKRAPGGPAPPFVVAYLSHVQHELAGAARAAGADLVLPRSRFVDELGPLLVRHGGAPAAQGGA